MIFKIDIDGVLRNSFKEMTRIYNLQFSDNLDYTKLPHYKIDLSFPLIKHMFGSYASEWLFEDHSYEIFYLSEAFDNVKEAIDKLIEAGHTISIVSHQQSYKNALHTLMWLEKYNIKYHNISFTKDKHLIKGDYLIDDFVDNLKNERLFGFAEPIMIKRSYNEYCKDYESYNSINDFVDNFLKCK